LLYSLLLVEANASKAVRSRPPKPPPTVESNKKPKTKSIYHATQKTPTDWADLFVSSGGLNHVIAIFTRLTTSTASKTAKTNRCILAMDKIISFCIGSPHGARNLKKLPTQAALGDLVGAAWWTLNDLLRCGTPRETADQYLTAEGVLRPDYDNPQFNSDEDNTRIGGLKEIRQTAVQTMNLIAACFNNQPELVRDLLSERNEGGNIELVKSAVVSSLVRCEIKEVRRKAREMWEDR